MMIAGYVRGLWSVTNPRYFHLFTLVFSMEVSGASANLLGAEIAAECRNPMSPTGRFECAPITFQHVKQKKNRRSRERLSGSSTTPFPTKVCTLGLLQKKTIPARGRIWNPVQCCSVAAGKEPGVFTRRGMMMMILFWHLFTEREHVARRCV